MQVWLMGRFPQTRGASNHKYWTKFIALGQKESQLRAPFDPLMERIEEQNQTSSSPNKTNPKTSSEKLDPSLLRKKSECCSPTDETEEWAQVRL